MIDHVTVNTVWNILFAPLAAAAVIMLFTRRFKWLSAGISIAAILYGFAVSLQLFYLMGKENTQVLSPAGCDRPNRPSGATPHARSEGSTQ